MNCSVDFSLHCWAVGRGQPALTSTGHWKVAPHYCGADSSSTEYFTMAVTLQSISSTCPHPHGGTLTCLILRFWWHHAGPPRHLSVWYGSTQKKQEDISWAPHSYSSWCRKWFSCQPFLNNSYPWALGLPSWSSHKQRHISLYSLKIFIYIYL